MSRVPFSIYGVVHLQPLPGAPRFAGDFDSVLDRARSDAEAMMEGGVDGLVIENFGDAPFFPDAVPPITVAAMAVIVHEIVDLAEELEVGVNVLRNDAQAALAIASIAGADFIRVNVHQGVVVADQGILSGRAHETLRRREQWAPEVKIFADVSVKHSAPLGARPIEIETEDLVRRGLADAVLVTGHGTGYPVDEDELRRVRAAAGSAQVLIASGFDPANATQLIPLADGAIVGTWFERDGLSGAPVDVERVRELMRLVEGRDLPSEASA